MDITPHIPLVRWVANRYVRHAARFRIERDDLVNVGTLGLIRAGKKFDPELGYAFSTYAAVWIRSFIQRYLDDHARLVRIPVHVVGDAEKRAALPPERVVWLDGFDDDVVGKADGGADEALERRDVERLIDSIKSERTRRMVRLRYFQECSLKQIGAEFGVSRERARQLVARGLEEMRANATRRPTPPLKKEEPSAQLQGSRRKPRLQPLGGERRPGRGAEPQRAAEAPSSVRQLRRCDPEPGRERHRERKARAV